MKWKKIVSEVSGWNLEDEDITLVNDEECGKNLYIVKLWWGSGYMLDCYNAYAFSEEEALNYVVAYIEKTRPRLLKETDSYAKELLKEIMDEQGCDQYDAEESAEFQETFMYVDATSEGADRCYYIYSENLAIEKYPENHNYPAAPRTKHRR